MGNMGIGTYPQRRAVIRENDIAWSFEGVETTYGEVDVRVRKLANALREAGIQHGDRVAYVGFNHPALLETFFATTLLGAICVLVNPRLAASEVRYILGDSSPKIVMFGEDQRKNATKLKGEMDSEIAWFDVDEQEFESFLQGGSDETVEAEVADEDTAMLMYTSGTTGKPKGVMLSHKALFYQYVNCLISCDYRGTSLIAAPLFHIAGLNMLTLPSFMMGARIIIHRKFRATAVLETIQQEKVTSAFMVPAMLDSLAHEENFEEADLSSVRNMMVGGSPLPARMFRTWEGKGIVISQGFGMTESAPGVRLLDPQDGITKAGTAGRPHFFTESRVVDFDGNDVAPGESGEIIVRGPNVMTGYKIPREIRVVDEMPRTTTGKIRKNILRSNY